MDLIGRTKEAVKEFDNIRYRRMKKVFLDQDERMSINTSISSVPNASITESNDLDGSNPMPILDDDDSRSTDFASDHQQIYPDDDESLNSSQSSLQQPSMPMNSLLVGRHRSSLSQSTDNQMTANMHPRFSTIENNPVSFLAPLQIDVNESNVVLRNNVSTIVVRSSSRSRCSSRSPRTVRRLLSTTTFIFRP